MPATTTKSEQFLENLPEDRKQAIEKLRSVLLKHLPKGFEEIIRPDMIHYVVSLSRYPAGYHCNPKLPLGFISIDSKKNHISLHHLGLYGDGKLLEWFTNEYPLHSKSKLDMGKGCVRFKKPDEIPFDLIAELAAKVSPEQWIERYEAALNSRKK